MAQKGTLEVSREQVLAFRLDGQQLVRRLPAGKLTGATHPVGIRNSPPGSAGLAFAARIEDFTQEKLDAALTGAKTLVEVWSIRSSPFFFPTADTPVFTEGLLPFDEEGLRYCIKAVLPQLDLGDKTAQEALAIIAAAVTEVLDGRQLTKGELSTAVSQGVPKGFLYWCKGCQAYHVPESFFRLAIQKAGIGMVPRRSADTLLFTRLDQWLSEKLPHKDPAKLRQEALRRYLRGYGPSNPADFAAWAGLSPANARQVWQTLEAELVEVNFEKTRGWVLESDRKDLESPPEPQGVRLLPPYDPYLLATDRATLIPDEKLHPVFWKALGNPGAVLVNGEIVGNWRPQKKGKKLLLNVSFHEKVTGKDRAELETEAALITPLKGASTVEVQYEE
ncbi:MAG: AlkZ family DNA glycosylase [Chloroflexi bacterium]|nr:AlkZ family DNA glycosylase [Chloroflexota bacterium]OJV86797.1 MAG: hypothetical protein BGO39_13250 [Chloroflexi bacterium 54-19]